jgi:IPT/TIG domain
MEPRARTRTILRRVGMSAALAALLVPAAAGTAAAKSKHHKTPAPTISSISPRSLAIGESLTIRGRHFKRGRLKNTVAFKRKGAAAIFVKADKGTTRMLKLKLPSRLEKALLVRNGETVPTKLSLRVLASRFGKKFTSGKTAPMVFPPKPEGVKEPAPETKPDGDCDGDGQINSADGDDDNDLLPDNLEAVLGTDPCKFDTDGDGVSDGYEYQSAVDLNDDEYQGAQSILPAPHKLPYPNPLFGDADTDYDGDGLTLNDEYQLWKSYRDPAKGLNDLVYSDGNEFSAYNRDAAGHRPGTLVGADPEDKYRQFQAWAQSAGYWDITVAWAPSIDSLVTLKPTKLDDFNLDGTVETSEARWYDFDGNGKISDDERDEDADGLTNYDESTGRGTFGYWKGCYKDEKPYPIVYGGTSLVDPDSDGDGVRDGADDQDHDDIPNLMELSRYAAAQPDRGADTQGGCSAIASAVALPDPARGFVNPYNPCLPYIRSRTCSKHPSFGNLPAPFEPSTKIYLVLN